MEMEYLFNLDADINFRYFELKSTIALVNFGWFNFRIWFLRAWDKLN